jgi:hypothetical protein
MVKVSHIEFQRLWKFCGVMEKFLCPRVVWLQSKLRTALLYKSQILSCSISVKLHRRRGKAIYVLN